MAQNYRRPQTKLRKAQKGHGWTKLERIEMHFILVNLKNIVHLFSNFYQFISKCHLHSWKSILSSVAVISQMKDSCSANLTWRAHN